MHFDLLTRTGTTALLDLPWHEPLSDWTSDRLVSVPMGLHRHVVKVVHEDGVLYVLKELPPRLAGREYRFLRRLRAEHVPCVEVVGQVTDRRTPQGEALEAVLVTRHLPFSLPYRALFQREQAPGNRGAMLDGLVDLLVRAHLVGFFWGDCSLSNTLFRRDAGRLAAYLVDTETGEMHEVLSPGQREHDLDLAVERCTGELLDLQAGGLLPDDIDPIGWGVQLRERYVELWDELTAEETFGPHDRHRVDHRLRRINELGFDVEELRLTEAGGTYRLELSTQVVEPGRHRRRLAALTGLDVQENQARRLLNDLDNFRAWLESQEGRPLPERVVAARWLERSFEPTVAAVPESLRRKREPAELFHEILEHWYYQSTIEGRDMELADATASYIEHVLQHVPDEHTVVTDDLDDPGS